MEKPSSPMMFLRLTDSFLFFQHAQAAQQRQTGLHQRRQFRCKYSQRFGRDSIPESRNRDVHLQTELFDSAFVPRSDNSVAQNFRGTLAGVVLHDTGGEELHLLDARQCSGLIFGVESAFFLCSSRIHRCVSIPWHNDLSCCQTFSITLANVFSPRHTR